MDQWKPSDGLYQPSSANQPEYSVSGILQDAGSPSNRLPSSCPETSQRLVQEAKNPLAARKVQKADREKLRRDRLNEQFSQLGNALDPDRPKNDKATILTDTVQMLKDLTAQVNRLKAEYTSLTEESRELTQEKNELREEKTALKSEIDNLSAQYQQRVRVMYPWAAMDTSVVMGPPPPYPFPVPFPIPPGAIPIHHPSVQPYPVYRNQSPGTMGNPCTTYVPYSSPCNPQMEQSSAHNVLPRSQPSSNSSQTASRHDTRSRTSDDQHASVVERSEDFSDVATELELKTPGSAAPSPHSEPARDKEHSSEKRKNKQWGMQMKGSTVTDGSSSSRCSSSGGLQDTSSNSVGPVGDGSIADAKKH